MPGMEECVIRTERLMGGGGSVLNSSREKVPLFGLQFLKMPIIHFAERREIVRAMENY